MGLAGGRWRLLIQPSSARPLMLSRNMGSRRRLTLFGVAVAARNERPPELGASLLFTTAQDPSSARHAPGEKNRPEEVGDPDGEEEVVVVDEEDGEDGQEGSLRRKTSLLDIRRVFMSASKSLLLGPRISRTAKCLARVMMGRSEG